MEDFPIKQLLQKCKEDMQDTLNAMPTSLEYDLELLRENRSSIPLIYRIGRKKLLVKHLQSMDLVISKVSVVLDSASADVALNMQLL